jgi:hypothetical protein
MAYLRIDSGATSSSASACPGLSARASASVVAALTDPGNSVAASLRASIAPPARDANRSAASTRRITASGRLSGLPHRLAELSQQAGDRARLNGRHAQRAHRRDRPFPGRIKFHRRLDPGLGRCDQRAVHARQVAARLEEGGPQARDHRRRRHVTGEMPGKLGRDMRRGRRVHRQVAQDSPRLVLAILAIAFAEHGPHARFVDRRREPEPPRRALIPSVATPEARYRPPRHRSREFGDVVLTIAGAHPQRVQFEDLAREVFVQPDLAPAPRRDPHAERAVRSDRYRLVEIEQHCRVPFDRRQHVAEPAQHMWPDRLELERPRQPDHRQPVGRHRKVIRPEMHEPLDERGLRGERGDRAGGNRSAIIVPRLLPHRLPCGPHRVAAHRRCRRRGAHGIRRRCGRASRALRLLIAGKIGGNTRAVRGGGNRRRADRKRRHLRR